MPIYPYKCLECSYIFDVIKPVSQIDKQENCLHCQGVLLERVIALSAIEKSSAVQPYYEPALGCMIKSKSQKQKVMKKLGVEEIGNTSPDTMYKDLEIAREKRIAREWDQI
jgi:putative FmdB family regulatory protein